MKMWKLLCYDIKYGCIKNLKLLLFPVIFEMAVLFMLWQKMNSYAQYGISTQKHMGDVLLYNFGGMEKYKNVYGKCVSISSDMDAAFCNDTFCDSELSHE